MDRYEYASPGLRVILGPFLREADREAIENWRREVDEHWRRLLAELDEQTNARRMEAMG